MSLVRSGDFWVYDGKRYTVVSDSRNNKPIYAVVCTDDRPYSDSIPMKINKMMYAQANATQAAGLFVFGGFVASSLFWLFDASLFVVLGIVATSFILAAVCGAIIFKNKVDEHSNIHGRPARTKHILNHNISELLKHGSIRQIVLYEIFEGQQKDLDYYFSDIPARILDNVSGTSIEDEVTSSVVGLLNRVSGEKFHKLDVVKRRRHYNSVAGHLHELLDDTAKLKERIVNDFESRRGWALEDKGRRAVGGSVAEEDTPVALIDPSAVVGAVKDEIGLLRTDICWVIDNPAFFDSHSSISSKLFEALGNWDDMGFSDKHFSNNELSEKALNIKQLFGTAKSRAEQIGFDHLNGQSRIRVERASKLVHKAESTNSVEEHDLYMGKAAELLAGIMDVILPRQAVVALERYSPAAIEHTAN